MTDNNQQLQAARTGKKFDEACAKLKQLLAEANDEKLQQISKDLDAQLETYKKQGVLRVAFVGQYNAGKSTIISGLTGRRDIKINADVATHITTPYNWNKIHIVDTPGLWADRKDHDQKTYEAIKKADLLIFCLTHMLFDDITVDNFNKLAYEQNYRWKMMLVINKMSAEAGEENQKIASYRQSLADAINPHSLDDFSVCFIDAKDYCEGIDDNDKDLIEISRFPSFVDRLNTFISKKGTLAHFDTPVRIALASIDEAVEFSTIDDLESQVFFETLNRLSKALRDERRRLKNRIESLKLEYEPKIMEEAKYLCRQVGSDNNFNELHEESNKNIRRYYDEAAEQINKAFKEALFHMKAEIKEVLESELFDAFFKTFILPETQNIPTESSTIEYGLYPKNLAWIKLVTGFNTFINVSGLATLASAEAVNAEKLANANNPEKVWGIIKPIKEADLVETQLTKFVEKGGTKLTRFVEKIEDQLLDTKLEKVAVKIGKKIKLKPGKAIQLSTKIANFAKYLPFALEVVGGLVKTGVNHIQQKKYEQQIAEVRSKINDYFYGVAQDFTTQIEKQSKEIERLVYEWGEEKIEETRQKKLEEIAKSNNLVEEILPVRKEFEDILSDISEAANQA